MKKCVLSLLFVFLASCSSDDFLVESLEKSCDEGVMTQCHFLATLYEKGRTAKMNKRAAVKLYQKSCDGGVAASCTNLGLVYLLVPTEKDRSKERLDDRFGYGVNPDPREGVALLEKGCTGGDAAGCFHLAETISKGTGAAGDLPAKELVRVEQLYRQACDGTAAKACAQLGRLMEHGLVETSGHAQVFELFEKACEKGFAEECMYLGNKYSSQSDEPDREAKAVASYRRACDRNHPPGCFRLGYAYENGLGIKEDKFTAFDFYKKSCDSNHPDACVALGEMHQRGDNVRQDAEKALKLFGKACDLRSEDGCKNYAILKGSMAK